jgi:hypothetical protein
MTITKREREAPTLSSKIIETPPTLRHSGQAQRRSGTHAVDDGAQIGCRKKHLNDEVLGVPRESCAIKRDDARTACNAHFTHIHTSTMTVRKAHIYVPRGIRTSLKAADISRNDISLAKYTYFGRGDVGACPRRKPKGQCGRL